MPPAIVVVPSIRGSVRQLFVQGVTPAPGPLVLLGQFNHLFLQFHQPTIRLQVVRNLLLPRLVVAASDHVSQFVNQFICPLP